MRQERTSKDERDLRSLKKRLDKYHSAKEAIFDPFFSDLTVDHGMWVISGEAEKREKKKRKDGSLSCTYLAGRWADDHV